MCYTFIKGGYMQKKDYILVAKNEFKGKTKNCLLKQIDDFYRLSEKSLKRTKYKVGDNVSLPANTYLHGFGDSLEVFDIIAENGLINKDYEFGKTNHFTHHTVSLWHIRKKISLANYIVKYSGMSVEYNSKFEMIPYGELDNFVEKMKKIPHWSWRAESSMEIRFMPSLAKDKNQLALIINGRDKSLKDYFAKDLINKDFDFEIAKNFLNEKQQSRTPEELRNAPGIQRIAYLLFGIPKSLFEGVLVGRKFEKNKNILRHIKEKLPDCYICNLDGKVIVE